MDDRELLEGRLRELDHIAYQRDILKHSGFLSLSEQAVFHRLFPDFKASKALLFGGHKDCERAAACFLPSYMEAEDAEAEILSCIKITAVNDKFADALTHRDYLGALMNLGIERDLLGDILTEEGKAYLFCLSGIAPYICDSLFRIRHTSVRCERAELSDCDIEPKFEELKVNVASERADAVIAAVYKLSRGTAAALIEREAVFMDGLPVTQTSRSLKEGARISVRGYGKFRYLGLLNTTKKGRLYVNVKKYS